MKVLLKKLNKKDIRALKTGAVAVVVIVLFVIVTNWLGHWRQIRKSLAERQEDF